MNLSTVWAIEADLQPDLVNAPGGSGLKQLLVAPDAIECRVVIASLSTSWQDIRLGSGWADVLQRESPWTWRRGILWAGALTSWRIVRVSMTDKLEALRESDWPGFQLDDRIDRQLALLPRRSLESVNTLVAEIRQIMAGDSLRLEFLRSLSNQANIRSSALAESLHSIGESFWENRLVQLGATFLRNPWISYDVYVDTLTRVSDKSGRRFGDVVRHFSATQSPEIRQRLRLNISELSRVSARLGRFIRHGRVQEPDKCRPESD